MGKNSKALLSSWEVLRNVPTFWQYLLKKSLLPTNGSVVILIMPKIKTLTLKL